MATEGRLQVYAHRLSQPSRSVLLFLSATGLEHELSILNIFQGRDQRAEEFLAVNPVGKVPAIRDADGFCLSEAAAIMDYLATSRGLTDWMPSELRARARVSMWMHWHHSNTRQITRKFFFPTVRGLDLADGRQVVQGVLESLERLLSGQGSDYVCGDHPTVADLLLLPEIDQIGPRGLNAFSLGAEEFPAIAAWLSRMEQLPGYEDNIANACTVIEGALALRKAATSSVAVSETRSNSKTQNTTAPEDAEPGP